jgi:hypothetical protein
MHFAATYLSQLFPASRRTPRFVCAHVLSPNEAATALARLETDAPGYLYSSLLSVAEALHGISKGCFTWGTVKLYYSTFYGLRAILAVDRTCVFHVGTPCYFLVCHPGETPMAAQERTHEAVLTAFEMYSSPHGLASQQIGGVTPMAWLLAQRTIANYSVGCFPDPDCPPRFKHLRKYSVNQLVDAYLGPSGASYRFDETHAMMAWPLSMLDALTEAASSKGMRLTKEQASQITKVAKADGRPLSKFLELVDRVRP